MEDILRNGYSVGDYDVNAVTWFYLSLPLIIAIFFRFTRVFSLRNLDLTLLLLMSPAVLYAYGQPKVGYLLLFGLCALLLFRLFFDGLLSRRPHLEQNLNVPGLAFLGAVTFVFLTLAAFRIDADQYASTMDTVRRGQQLLDREQANTAEQEPTDAGPASPIIAAPVAKAIEVVSPETVRNGRMTGDQITARVLAILAHAAVVAGLLVVGKKHFGDLQVGLAMATLYLLLPCTGYEVEKFNHVLPAALILWAFVFYRQPIVAGALMGLACGTLLFPVFLLPLWGVFYGRRGAALFFGAVGCVAALILGSFALTSASTFSFVNQTIGSINLALLQFRDSGAEGFWSTHDPVYRIPVFAAFVIMLIVTMIWPRRKTLEHLIAHSTAMVIGTQFWYPYQGGVYLTWYLPLLLLVVFRPRLSHVLPPEVGRSVVRRVPATDESRPQPAATAGARSGQFFR